MAKAFKCDVCKKLLEGEPIDLYKYQLETYRYLKERVEVSIEFFPPFHDRCKECIDMLIKDALQHHLITIMTAEAEKQAASEALEQEAEEMTDRMKV